MTQRFLRAPSPMLMWAPAPLTRYSASSNHGAIFACTINADVWVENGFGPKIQALTQGGVMHVREIRPGAYFKGDAAVGRFLVFQKC